MKTTSIWGKVLDPLQNKQTNSWRGTTSKESMDPMGDLIKHNMAKFNRYFETIEALNEKNPSKEDTLKVCQKYIN